VITPEEQRRQRAAARAEWPLRRYTLGEEPPEDLRDVTTPEQRLGMMWELARHAWLLAGRPLPDYTRDPGRLIRPR
jgi:hypothetical protein